MTRHGPVNEFCWMDLKTRDPSGTPPPAPHRSGNWPSPWTIRTP
ncbi:hypothetical protein [Streptomyces anulatus]|nr:hypothetical protein OG557_08090 [Streptomyces anulatus]